MLRISIIFFLLFLKGLLYGQEKSFPKIDSALLYTNYDFQKKGQLREGILFNRKIITTSKKRNYTKGIGWGYYNIGNILSSLNQYEESLKYLDLAEKELNKTNEFALKASLHTDIGKINHFLGLYEISLYYYNKAINESKKIKDIHRKKSVQNYAYACKADNFAFMNQTDSVRIYFQKAYKLIPDPITAANIADYFIVYRKNEIDSAEYYLKEASNNLAKNKYDLFQGLVVLMKYGNFYYEKKEYDKALEYYFQSLALAKRLRYTDKKKTIYQLISKTYKVLNNEHKAAEYLFKYTALNDSLSNTDKKILNISVDKFVEEKEIQKEKEAQRVRKNTYWIFGITLGVVLVLSIAGYVFYKKKRIEKELLIQNQQEEMEKKEVENKHLEDKVNNAFEEVVLLAKQNSPVFLARFKEVYPDFCEALLVLYPDIINSELRFCAYLKLNFSTKEIATYMFVTHKAVQTRKSRLRKKLNIQSEEDLYIWIDRI